MLKFIIPCLTLLLFVPSLSPHLMWLLSCSFLFFMTLSSMVSTPMVFNSLANMGFYADPLSVFLVVITSWVSCLMIIASQKTLMVKKAPYMFVFLIISLSMILMISFSSQSLIMFYIFFEASLIPTLLLILGWGYQPERLQASMYLIMYTVTASLPLLLSLTKLWKSSGHLSFLGDWSATSLPFSVSSIWWVITIAAFLVKTPLYLTHLWLPKAHVEAPVAGSMILAGVLLKLGSYGLMRLSFCFSLLSKWSSSFLISISLVGGSLASFVCIRQTDVKALIAYSSVGHMGLATGGILTNTSWGWQGAFMMLIAHGLCSSCLFSMANMTYETVSSRGVYLTKGLMTLFPSMTFWWFSFSACNMAAPPSINLAAEIMLISSSLSFSLLSAIPLSLMAFLAAAYSLLLYTSTQHGPLPAYQNPLSLFTPRNFSVTSLHLIPLIFFMMKIDLIIQPF